MPINQTCFALLLGLLTWWPFGQISLFAQKSTGVSLSPSNTEIGFRIKNAGFWVNGKLTKVQGTLLLNTDQPGQSSVMAKMPVSGLDTGNEARDRHLRKDDYFAASTYPEIAFSASGMQANPEGGYLIKGQLTIRNQTRPITLLVHQMKLAGTSYWVGTAALNRLNFGVGTSSWVLGDTVEITVKVRVE